MLSQTCQDLTVLSKVGLTCSRQGCHHNAGSEAALVAAKAEHEPCRKLWKLITKLMYHRGCSMLVHSTLPPYKWACVFHDDPSARCTGLRQIKEQLRCEDKAKASGIPFLLQKVGRSVNNAPAIQAIHAEMEAASFEYDQLSEETLQKLQLACGGLLSTCLIENWIRLIRNQPEGLEQLNKRVSWERRFQCALDSKLLAQFKRSDLPSTAQPIEKINEHFWNAGFLQWSKHFPGILKKRTWAAFTPQSYLELVGDCGLFYILEHGEATYPDASLSWKSQLLAANTFVSIADCVCLFYPAGPTQTYDKIWYVLGQIGPCALLWPIAAVGKNDAMLQIKLDSSKSLVLREIKFSFFLHTVLCSQNALQQLES